MNATARKPINPKQVQLIHIALGQIGMSDDVYRDRLAQEFGPHVTSCKQLNSRQANHLLEVFKRLGFAIRPRAARSRKAANRVSRNRKDVTRLVNRQQLDKIDAVAALIHWRHADGPALWMKKRLGVERVRTEADAFKVIEGLKKMFENSMKKQFGPLWWIRVFGDPRIEVYKDEHCPVDLRAMMLSQRENAGTGDGA